MRPSRNNRWRPFFFVESAQTRFQIRVARRSDLWFESLVKALDEFCDGLLVGQRIEQNELRTCSSHISLALPSLALAFPPFSFRSFSSPACSFLACLSPCLSLLSLASPFPSLPLRSVPGLPFPLLAFSGVPYCPFPPCLVFLSPKGH